jgi:hypothetical protein
MRKSFTTAVILVAALAIAAPTHAAQRRDNDKPSFTLILKKLVKKVFGISTMIEPVVPVPPPNGNN